MLRRIVLSLFAAVFVSLAAHAQDYNWSIGARGGAVATGLSVKGFISGASALEGIVSFVDGVNVYGLYERHLPVIGKGFSFYYGAGANLGSWKKHGKSKFTVGVDGVAGLEYKIENVPLAFGIDYKPTVNLFGHTGFKWYDFGASVRIAF